MSHEGCGVGRLVWEYAGTCEWCGWDCISFYVNFFTVHGFNLTDFSISTKPCVLFPSWLFVLSIPQIHTPDLGGLHTTRDMVQSVIDEIEGSKHKFSFRWRQSTLVIKLRNIFSRTKKCLQLREVTIWNSVLYPCFQRKNDGLYFLIEVHHVQR